MQSTLNPKPHVRQTHQVQHDPRTASRITTRSVALSPKAQSQASYYTNGGLCFTILRTVQLRGFLLRHKLLFLLVNMQHSIIHGSFTA
jgi:hypothetical protein